MPRCAAFKPNGEQCERIVGASNAFCFGHDPARQEERKRNASRAGRSKASKLIKELHDLIDEAIQQVKAGTLDTSRGAVMNQLVGTKIRLLEFERRSHETDELAAELEQIKREFKVS